LLKRKRKSNIVEILAKKLLLIFVDKEKANFFLSALFHFSVVAIALDAKTLLEM